MTNPMTALNSAETLGMYMGTPIGMLGGGVIGHLIFSSLDLYNKVSPAVHQAGIDLALS